MLGVGLAELILTGGWYLWWERRQFTHGESIKRPAKSGLSIATLTKNYKMTGKKGVKIRQGWRKPPEDTIMLNIDASFDEDMGCRSVGAIIRDRNHGDSFK